MKVHAISTGAVKVTRNWQVGTGEGIMRMVNTLFDSEFTDWLPIFCYVIEHPEGLIVIDTGIPVNANDQVWFPPFMPLVQRAAPFRITEAEEIGNQMREQGLNPDDVRWVVLTHLHQDHEGGLHYFKNAEFLVSRDEWTVASGFKGRMGGYLNFRWFDGFEPTLVDFDGATVGDFPGSYLLTEAGDVKLVPTPGHSVGHLSVILDEGAQSLFFAGDATYAQDLLLGGVIDGVGPDVAAQHETHQRILHYAATTPTVILPSHEWDAARRLDDREVVPVDGDVVFLQNR